MGKQSVENLFKFLVFFVPAHSLKFDLNKHKSYHSVDIKPFQIKLTVLERITYCKALLILFSFQMDVHHV